MDDLINKYEILPLPSSYDAVELDMGCGRGGFTRDLALRFPNRLILASDVMTGRLHTVEHKLKGVGALNARTLRAESGMLVEFQLPPHSIHRLHLLCPDPWPKDLPRKGRRLASQAFLCLLPRILTPRGIFHFSSDDVPYFDSVYSLLKQHPMFQEAPEGLDDIRDIKTDFERLWEAEGKTVRHTSFRLK